MNNDKKPTRYYSDIQEKAVCKLLGAIQQSNSGAGRFSGGDVILREASLLIECKTVVSDKESVSIKKEWIKKNKEEAFSQRLANSTIAINFGPGQENYFLINENLMKLLVEALKD